MIPSISHSLGKVLLGGLLCAAFVLLEVEQEWRHFDLMRGAGGYGENDQENNYSPSGWGWWKSKTLLDPDRPSSKDPSSPFPTLTLTNNGNDQDGDDEDVDQAETTDEESPVLLDHKSQEMTESADSGGDIDQASSPASPTSVLDMWLLPEHPDVAAADRVRQQIVGDDPQPLKNCHPTVQVRVEKLAREDKDGPIVAWRLRSIDEHGNDKTVGGDEFYVTFALTIGKETEAESNKEQPLTDSDDQDDSKVPRADLVAWVRDLNDGTYELDFETVPLIPSENLQLLASPNATGVLTVHFQYTCGIGLVPRPLKQEWKSGGSTRATHSSSSTFPVPSYREFQPPNQDHGINLGRYDVVVAFGDSLIRRLVKPLSRTLHNIHYFDNPSSTLTLGSLPYLLERLEKWHGEQLSAASKEADNASVVVVNGTATPNNGRMVKHRSEGGNRGSESPSKPKKVALMTGSAVWDISKTEGADFHDHLTACREFVQTIQQRYPGVDIYWKSPSAVHIHRALPTCYEKGNICSFITRYVSTSRMMYLYQQQRMVMSELGIPWLDVYESFFLSADNTLSGDVRHFDEAIDDLILSFFYPDFDYLAYLREHFGEADQEAEGGDSTAHEKDVVLDAAPTIWLLPEQPDVTAANLVHNQIVGDDPQPLKNCDPTVQVRLEQVVSEGDNGPLVTWRLHSIDEYGHDKTIGGDEFYVTFALAKESGPSAEQPSTESDAKEGDEVPRADLVAWVRDLNNGTYDLDFETVPLIPPDHLHGLSLPNATGTLTVYFQYTCGIGSVPHSLKFYWKSGGSTRATYSSSNAFPVPRYREFQPPNQDHSIDLGQYDAVVAFGDSLIRRLVMPLKWTLHNIDYHDNPKSPLTLAALPHLLGRLEEWHGAQLAAAAPRLENISLLVNGTSAHDSSRLLRHQASSPRKVALMIGSAVWDISQGANQGTDFADHLQACREYVQTIRQRYPNVDIYWKSPSAVHIHKAFPSCYDEGNQCIGVVRYVSTSRMMYLYQQQKILMAELGIPWLDVYESFFLSADDTLSGDVRHYDEAIDDMILSFFYPKFDFEGYRHDHPELFGAASTEADPPRVRHLRHGSPAERPGPWSWGSWW